MSLSMTQFWLIAIALLLLVEFATSALTTIWFAGGALIALLCAIAGGPVWLQVVLFIAGSAVLLLLTRPMAVKMLKKGTVATNAGGRRHGEDRQPAQHRNCSGQRTRVDRQERQSGARH